AGAVMHPGPARPLVALISANPTAMTPANSAFAERFPEARLWNILDDRLQEDADSRGVTGSLAARLRRLVDHAVLEGADAALLTCPVYTPAARSYAARCPIPLLDPDEMALEAILQQSPATVLVLASAHQPLSVSLNRFINESARHGVPVETRGAVAAGALDAARRGNTDDLTQALAAVIASQPTPPDAVLLAQYSLAPVAGTLETATGIPVFSGPLSSAAALRRTILGGSR
ncbi:aspartate/glutamate racemase family protein, partial [Paenarthrobacter sp. NPDC090522]|uniref:aspartate/glutamate racemase family protein n=1 Tax=Paenarthrobacter sp. NPDC090522 TaxID=3364383 RepID=UPI003814315B